MTLTNGSLCHFSGEDYEATEYRLVYPPNVTSLPVPIRIIDDFVPEPPEFFRLNLFQVVESPTVALAGTTADVQIIDEDGKKVCPYMYIDMLYLKNLL